MSFKKTQLSFEETKLFPQLLMDYVNGDASLSPFYQYKPVISEFENAIEDRGKKSINRLLLVKTIKDRYQKNAPGLTEFTQKNILQLADDNCFTVTTGHQLCLFTGPLYFIYKIISTINLSQKLREEYPDKHFVPVYWMASEDHDFAEVNHAYLFGKKVEWKSEAVGGPVGKIPTDSLKPVLDELFSIMGEGGKTSGLQELFNRAYTSYKTLSEATFFLVDKLFGKYGLVIIDADNAELKKEFLPVITDELQNQNSFKLISETNEKLSQAGVEAQVNSREINLFYMDEKGRNRIEKQGDKYVIVGTDKTFTTEEITALLKQSPEKFSPNVVLRPVYQQMILPNLAYIGGPSEIHYWMQLKAVFEKYNVMYPVLIPRSSATIIDKATKGKMDKLKLTVKDLFRDVEEVVKEFVTQNSTGDIAFETEKEQLAKIYETIIQKTKEIDPTVATIPEAELQKQYNALKNIETKLMRAQKQKHETSVAQIRKLKEKLFPDGVLQERHDNFIPFYLAYGESFIETLAQNLTPFEYRMTVLEEE
jgi:bacillithiol biosynthesis cysteine-adding enzyme BshC